MLYGKIINNILFVASDCVKTDTGWITNPTEKQLKDIGYKIVEYTEQPSYDDEEEKLVEKYTETENKIIVEYNKIALTTEEHNEVILTKIIEEENKITPRNIRGALLGVTFDINEVNKIESNIAALRAKLR